MSGRLPSGFSDIPHPDSDSQREAVYPSLGWSIKRFADAMDYESVTPVYKAIYRGEIPTFRLFGNGDLRIPAKWAENMIAEQIARGVSADAKSATPPTREITNGVAMAGGDSDRRHR